MLKAKLILDLGNSETRAVLRVGEMHDKTRREYAFKLSNRFNVALDGIPKSEDYNEENTTIFKTRSIKVGSEFLAEGIYINGLMSDREFEGIQMKPTAVSAKYNSAVTPLSIFTAIVKSGMWMKNFFEETQGRVVPLDSLIDQIEWELDVLLPPSQVNKGLEQLTNILIGDFPVEFVMPVAKTNIHIKKINVLSEGIMAYMSILIKKSNKKVRANKKFMLQSNVLVVDIGAGTTDIVLVRNNVPVEASKNTIRYGGNNIKSRLKQKVNAEYDLALPDSYYEEAVITGKIKRNLEEYDVRSQLDIAKREIAMLINNSIQEYLEAADISIQTVEYILVVGGGSITPNIDGIKPISNYILDGFKRFSPKIGLIDISDVTEQDGVLNGTLDASPVDKYGVRELNVVGAGINLDLREIKEYTQSQVTKL